MQGVGRSSRPFRQQRLERQLQIGQRLRVDQVAQLLLAEQLAQQLTVEGQRPGPTLRQRRVALVHVRREVVEQERAGEGRGRDRLHVPNLDLATRHSPQDLAQGGQVEEVGQALTVGLDDDRERAIATGHRQEPGRTLALQPERRPRTGPAPRQQQSSRGVLAESSREHGRACEPPHYQVLDLIRGRKEQLGQPTETVRGEPLRQPNGDPVVRPDRLGIAVQPFQQPRLDRQSPRRVDAPTERRQDHDPPVAQLVAEPLDHDPPIRRQPSGHVPLLGEVAEHVLGSQLVQVVALQQPSPRSGQTALAAAQIDL